MFYVTRLPWVDQSSYALGDKNVYFKYSCLVDIVSTQESFQKRNCEKHNHKNLSILGFNIGFRN